MFRLFALAAAVLLAGCSPEARAPETPFDTTSLPMPELMGHVLDPAADAVWGASGVEVTEAGERDLSPQTPEAWETVANAAAVVAESGNLLLLPGRNPGEERWVASAREMTRLGVQIRDAADRRDKQAVFDLGGQLYTACVSCHDVYMPQGSPLK